MADSAITLSNNLGADSITETQLAAGATLQLGTYTASTSGTAVTFTGIPAGTKQIIISLLGVSTNGTDELTVRLGDAGGIETTGYSHMVLGSQNAGTTVGTQPTDGFELTNAQAAADVSHVVVVLTLVNSALFTWTCLAIGSQSVTDLLSGAVGNKALSQELSQVSITTNAADTFDAGNINIAYK